MNWSTIAQIISDVLALTLIVRLLILRLQDVYRIFGLFLLWELLGSLITFIESFVHIRALDYRVTWICTRMGAWILSLWMVYALLNALLMALPGILRFSRKLMNVTFLLALLLALSTARTEYLASELSGSLDGIDRAVGVTFVLERVISMAAVLVLLLILGFVLWFPVRMPRNLAVFSLGYVVYFASKTGLLLARSYWSPQNVVLLSTVLNVILSACFAYWIAFITPEGETATVRIGHSWHTVKQEHLLGQLEAMNASLSRLARR